MAVALAAAPSELSLVAWRSAWDVVLARVDVLLVPDVVIDSARNGLALMCVTLR